MGVGMPAAMLLQEFGSQVWAAFGGPPYHVGSSLTKKDGWRDVDVRMILPDDVWDAMGLGPSEECQRNGKWRSLCLAYSALGKAMTGLNVDFQIQRETEANACFDGPRSTLGMVPLRMARGDGNA